MLRVSMAIGDFRKITVTQIYRSFLICNFSVGHTLSYIYLRNKETQQTLQVIINIQYDASF